MSKQTIASQLDLAGFSPDHVSADGVSYFRGKEGDGYEISKIEVGPKELCEQVENGCPSDKKE